MTHGTGRFLALLAFLLLAGCATVRDIEMPIEPVTPEMARCQGLEEGNASYYANKFHGRRTASGERFDNNAMTAAHKSLPFGTMIRVTNTDNGKSVTVRVNDRGPFIKGRIVDLSKAAARKVGMMGAGVVPVTLCRL